MHSSKIIYHTLHQYTQVRHKMSTLMGCTPTVTPGIDLQICETRCITAEHVCISSQFVNGEDFKKCRTECYTPVVASTSNMTCTLHILGLSNWSGRVDFIIPFVFVVVVVVVVSYV
jgi:hypothetical protein